MDKYLDMASHGIEHLEPIASILLTILLFFGIAVMLVVIIPFAIIGIILTCIGIRRREPEFESSNACHFESDFL